MALETMTQTEVKDPPFGKIAEAILTIGSDAKAQGHDQETIRAMLLAFSQACGRENLNGMLPRPY